MLHDNSYRMFDSHVSAHEIGFYVRQRMQLAGLDAEDASLLYPSDFPRRAL